MTGRPNLTLVVPPPARVVTPEIAQTWLRERLRAYMQIAAAGALADDHETREALHFLVVDVGTIADACVAAATTMETVRLETTEREDDPENFDDETEMLRTALRAQRVIRDRWGDGEHLREAFAELSRALGERERGRSPR